MIYKYEIIGVVALFLMVGLSVYAEYAPVEKIVVTDKIENKDYAVIIKRPDASSR
ncbi:MAG TPA: hypothetical protein VD699_04680 [Nitrosopumilaceae archaeon]|nr:hypothetical protein [Nitrosopumilaceae archaeon]